MRFDTLNKPIHIFIFLNPIWMLGKLINELQGNLSDFRYFQHLPVAQFTSTVSSLTIMSGFLLYGERFFISSDMPSIWEVTTKERSPFLFLG